MNCSNPFWVSSFNMLLNGIAIYMLILLFIDVRRIERRYEGLLKLVR